MEKRIMVRLSCSGQNDNINALGQFLVNFQTLVYSAGEIAAGHNTKKSGDYPKYIKDACTLKITSVKQGSIQLWLAPTGEEQQTLANGSIAEKSISLTYGVVEALNNKNREKMLNKYLPDPLSRKRMLERIQDVLPVNEESFLELGLDSKKQELKFSHRKIIQDLIPKISLPDSKRITGRLTEIRVDGKKEFQIDSKDEVVNGEFDPSLEDFFKRSIGQIVEIEAKVDPKHMRTKLLVTSTSNYRKLDFYPIQEFCISKKQCLLKAPLEVDVQFDDTKTYVLYESEFKILATGRKLKDAIKDFNDQFVLLYNEYAKADDASLTKQARELKKKLLNLVGE